MNATDEAMGGIMHQYAKCEVCGVDSGCQYEVNGPEVFRASNEWVRDHSRCIEHPATDRGCGNTLE